ncbi:MULTISPECIES: TetR/AcrR family transcriptional regulator [Niveispirillum]|uniref:TetR family transcriptional regulator n=2 Tax=Niveispirillum TaxID=1543704 RepID=A0A255Z846_9PROT|nr:MULTISPECIES: TetR/AcrR family transcriptional regulator [Niveispirillum]AUN31010.1 TetR/AcrR family transcriptional regulator [Niveispirillum cyanobacteriorum]OYQ37055.1 TetR family transcriptional regulator [Niveispirillum lacus]GGE87842.1 TetR family transcriptional regulator [Niveispirillum cyanobacteriorum]
MARKQSADYEQRREAIIDRAADLFAVKGYLGSSVADLAEACQTSKSLIYHYYPSKEDILHAVMASHVEQLTSAATDVAAMGPDPAVRLRELARRFMRLYIGAASRQKVLLNDLAHLPPKRRAEIVAGQRALVTLVEEILGALHPPLIHDAAHRRTAAMLFFGMINWTHTWMKPTGPLGADEIADMSTGMVLKGIKGI